jgi:hypothetical protein
MKDLTLAEIETARMHPGPPRPMVLSKALDMARRYLALRERIEETRRTWNANSDKYKKLHVADFIHALDRALLLDAPTEER